MERKIEFSTMLHRKAGSCCPTRARGLDVGKGHRRLLPRIARSARGRPSPGARTGGTRPGTPQGTAGLSETLVWTPVRGGLRGGRRSLPRASLPGIRQFKWKLAETRGNINGIKGLRAGGARRPAENRHSGGAGMPAIGPTRPGDGIVPLSPANRQRRPNPRPITVCQDGPMPALDGRFSDLNSCIRDLNSCIRDRESLIIKNGKTEKSG